VAQHVAREQHVRVRDERRRREEARHRHDERLCEGGEGRSQDDVRFERRVLFASRRTARLAADVRLRDRPRQREKDGHGPRVPGAEGPAGRLGVVFATDGASPRSTSSSSRTTRTTRRRTT
jgi:hypothetical protein